MQGSSFFAKLKYRNVAVAFAVVPAREFEKALTQK
jgi:hypothetical protein